MRHLIILLATLLPAAAQAEEGNDTTFTVKDKKIVVDVQDAKTTVKVYNRQGYLLSPVRETEYVDGQEVERVYVGSPFVPAENLQNVSFRPHFPTVWMGMKTIGRSPFSSNTGDTHARRSKSFELGFTPWSFAVPFDKARTVGLMAAVQVAWVHQCFQKDYAVGQSGGLMTYTPLDARAEGNNMNYGVLRVPVMLSWQQDYSWFSCSLGLSGEVRTNASYRLTPAAGATVSGVPDALKLQRFGANFEAGFGFGPITLTATIGLTPTFKTATGTKAYSGSACIGLDVLELAHMIKTKAFKD